MPLITSCPLRQFFAEVFLHPSWAEIRRKENKINKVVFTLKF
jgi:hypothetical protein